MLTSVVHTLSRGHSSTSLVSMDRRSSSSFFFFQAEDGIRDYKVTGVQTCALPISLGASKWKTIVTVIVPSAYRGILTTILLAFARVAGETAPLLFTALGNRFWSPGWGQPTASLDRKSVV